MKRSEKKIIRTNDLSELHGVLHATYAIDVTQLPSKWSEESWYKGLTITPKSSTSCPLPALPLNTCYLENGVLHVPRFAGLHMFGAPSADTRTLGVAMNLVHFTGVLRDVPPQIDATTQVLQQLQSEGGAMLVLPCGFGKTVCSLWVAHQLSRRTLVIVHSEALADQWRERIHHFLPGATIGKIQKDVVNVDCDFVIAMIQSLLKRNYAAEVFNLFGTVIIDESHHVAAPTFSKIIPKLPSRYILGLSATPDRPDGCGAALEWLMGKIAYKAQRASENVLVHQYAYTTTPQKVIFNKRGEPLASTMLSHIAGDERRNNWILSILQECLQQDRKIIVLSDRLDQLLFFEAALVGTSVGRVVGGMKAALREKGFEATVILSTYQYASEGIDIPRLDTLIMATPRSNIEQSLGRILREHPTKQTPLVIDIKDPVSLFEAMSWKRHKYYVKQQYKTTFKTDEDYFKTETAELFFDDSEEVKAPPVKKPKVTELFFDD